MRKSNCERKKKIESKTDETQLSREIVYASNSYVLLYYEYCENTRHIFYTYSIQQQYRKKGREFDCNRDIYRIIIIFCVSVCVSR